MNKKEQSIYRGVVTALAAIAAVLMIAAAVSLASEGSEAAAIRTCFPASHWAPAPDRLRPCVQVTHVEEDGSFAYRVTDADGVVRYSAGIGALDR